MGRSFACSVGPYAEWLIPDDGSVSLEPEDEGGEPLFGEYFGRNTRSAPVVEVDGKKYRRVCYWQRAAAAGPPFKAVVLDYTNIDIGKAIARFERRTARMLKELSERFGCEAVVKWGFVSRYD